MSHDCSAKVIARVPLYNRSRQVGVEGEGQFCVGAGMGPDPDRLAEGRSHCSRPDEAELNRIESSHRQCAARLNAASRAWNYSARIIHWPHSVGAIEAAPHVDDCEHEQSRRARRLGR